MFSVAPRESGMAKRQTCRRRRGARRADRIPIANRRRSSRHWMMPEFRAIRIRPSRRRRDAASPPGIRYAKPLRTIRRSGNDGLHLPPGASSRIAPRYCPCPLHRRIARVSGSNSWAALLRPAAIRVPSGRSRRPVGGGATRGRPDTDSRSFCGVRASSEDLSALLDSIPAREAFSECCRIRNLRRSRRQFAVRE